MKHTADHGARTEIAVKALLAEGLESCREREVRAFDEAAFGTKGTVLFGAGGLGRRILATLRSAGIVPLAFADNNRSLWEKRVEDIPVIAPAEAAARYGTTAAFVITIWASWNDSMQDQIAVLRSLGCRTVIPFPLLAWKFPAPLLPHVQIDLPSRVHEQREDVIRCAHLWADDESAREYVAQLRWCLRFDFTTLGQSLPAQYWQSDLIHLGDDAVFVDAGAFDGDTIAQFLEFTESRFGRIYAFEPDGRNFGLLQERVSRMPQAVQSRICWRQQAVGDFDGLVPFNGGIGASSYVGGEGRAECVTLDSAVSECPSYIKYDVEGFEPKALRGSRRIISGCKPVLAVCVYHCQDHLWQLPLQIHSINPNYRFHLRAHGQIWETVCYAVPEAY